MVQCVGPFQHGNEYSESIKGEGLIDQSSYYFLLKKGTPPQN
jgi:hypothetical protein